MKLVTRVRNTAAAILVISVSTGVVGATTSLDNPLTCAASATDYITVPMVIDTGALGSTVEKTCVTVPKGATGSDVLIARAEKLNRPAPRFSPSGFLCGIDGKPATGCGETAGNSYWSYWLSSPSQPRWGYSTAGSDFRNAVGGVAEGWRFITPDAPVDSSAPRFEAAKATCASASTPTTAQQPLPTEPPPTQPPTQPAVPPRPANNPQPAAPQNPVSPGAQQSVDPLTPAAQDPPVPAPPLPTTSVDANATTSVPSSTTSTTNGTTSSTTSAVDTKASDGSTTDNGAATSDDVTDISNEGKTAERDDSEAAAEEGGSHTGLWVALGIGASSIGLAFIQSRRKRL